MPSPGTESLLLVSACCVCVSVFAAQTKLSDVNTNMAGTTDRRHRTNLDAGGSWRLTNTYSLSVSVRNILDTPYINMQRFATRRTTITRKKTLYSPR